MPGDYCVETVSGRVLAKGLTREAARAAGHELCRERGPVDVWYRYGDGTRAHVERTSLLAEGEY